MPRPNAKTLLLTALLMLAPLAHAERADSGKPINVDAGRVQQDQKTGRTTLEGGVKLIQGTLSLDADQALMQQTPDGEQTVHAEGRPVKFRQKMEGQNVWLDGKADKLEYDSKSGEVKLIGHAWIKRGDDETSGSVISYNTNTELYSAEGGQPTPTGGDGRVRMVIQPMKKPATPQAKP